MINYYTIMVNNYSVRVSLIKSSSNLIHDYYFVW